MLRERYPDLCAYRIEHIFVDMAKICSATFVDDLDHADEVPIDVENRRSQTRSRFEAMALVERIVEKRRLIGVFDVDPLTRFGTMTRYPLP